MLVESFLAIRDLAEQKSLFQDYAHLCLGR